MENIFGLVGVIVFVIVLIPMAAYLSFSSRLWLRHRYRDHRAGEAGPMRWAKLTVQQRPPIDPKLTPGELANAQSIEFARELSMDDRDKRGRTARAVASFVWVRDADGQVTLYAGCTKGHVKSLSGYVRSLGYETAKVARPPIPEGQLAVAYRSRTEDVKNVRETPVEVGRVADALSATGADPCAVILTLERARTSEEDRYERNLAESKLMRQGDSGASSALTTSQPASVAATQLMRASIGAVVQNGSLGQSASVLRTVTSKMTGLVSTVSARSMAGEQRRLGGIMGVAGLALGVAFILLGGLVGIVPGVAIAGMAGAGLAMNFMGLGNKDVARYLHSGELAVPNYFYFSPRYLLLSRWNSHRTNGAGGEQVGNRIAPPSTPQVIPLYSTPLSAYVTTPTEAYNSLDVTGDAVPHLSLPQTMMHFTENDIPLGLSYYKKQPAVLPLKTLELSMAVFGAPQSGKTNFLQTVWSSVCVASFNHADGLTINPIWVETKGEGAYDSYGLAYKAWTKMKAAGRTDDSTRPLMIDAHNPDSGHRLILEGKNVRNDPDAEIEDIISDIDRYEHSIEYGFGSNAISHRSSEFMREAFRIFALLTEEEVNLVINASTDANDDSPVPHVVARYPHVMKAAWILLCGDMSIPVGKRMLGLTEKHTATLREVRQGKATISRIEADRINQIVSSVKVLEPLYRGERQSETDVRAPRNKLSKFISATAVFQSNESREHITPEDLVNSNRPIILNFGPYQVIKDGQATGDTKRVLDDENSRLLGIFSNYIIWSYVKNVGSSWGRIGKRVPVFADEVADLAVDSPDSGDNYFADALKEGRSRGFSYYLAAQSPQQIPESAREAMLSIRTKFFFQMPNATDAATVVEQLASGDSGEVNVRHVTDLPQGVAIGRIYAGFMSPPFSLMTPKASSWASELGKVGNPVQAVTNYQKSVGGPMVDQYQEEWEDGDDTEYSYRAREGEYERDDF